MNIDRELLLTSHFRQVPGSAGHSANTATHSINLGSDTYSSTATSDGGNAAYSDTNEVGREITIVDTATNFATLNYVGRKVRIDSGPLAGKTLQIVSAVTTTATLNYPSGSDTTGKVLSGNAYTILPDYSPGAKILLLGISQYNKGSMTIETAVIFRVTQNGGTVYSTGFNPGSTDPQMLFTPRIVPMVFDTQLGAIQFQFQKGPTIGTSTWVNNIRHYVHLAVSK